MQRKGAECSAEVQYSKEYCTSALHAFRWCIVQMHAILHFCTSLHHPASGGLLSASLSVFATYDLLCFF